MPIGNKIDRDYVRRIHQQKQCVWNYFSLERSSLYGWYSSVLFFGCWQWKRLTCIRHRLVGYIATARAVAITGIITTFVLKRLPDRRSHLLMILSSSVGIFGLFRTSLPFSFMNFLEYDTPAWHMMRWIFAAIGILLAIASGFLLRERSRRSLQLFLCLSAGLGAGAFAQLCFFILILIFGYVDWRR